MREDQERPAFRLAPGGCPSNPAGQWHSPTPVRSAGRRWALALLYAAVLLFVMGPARGAGQKDLVKVPITQVPAVAKKALVIGIGEYRRANSLSLSVKDAKAFAALLRDRMGFPADAVTLMTDDAPNPEDRPTYTNVRGRVRRLMQGVDEDTVLVFFYSGHGVHEEGEDWLVPADGDPEDVRGTCVSATRELVNPLKVKQYNRALLFFDACRSVVSRREPRGGDFGLSTKAVALPQLAELYSCQAKQVSLEGRGTIGNGVFTHFLLQALGGEPEAADQEGNVTFASLMRYVRGSVSDYAKNQFGVDQDPIGYATSGDMVLARVARVRPEPPRDGGAAELAREAFRLLDAQQNAGAAGKARQAVAADPGNALADAVLGGARLRLGDRVEGEKEVREALRLDRESALGHAGLGLFHGLEQRKQDARREFEKAVQLDPKLALAHQELGILYQAQRRFEEAEREFRTAIDLRRQAGDERAYPYILLCTLSMQRGNVVQAGELAKRILEIEPSSPMGHFAAGSVAAAAQKFDDAEREYRRAIELAPTQGLFYTGPGLIAIVRQDLATAERYFRRWSEIAPDDPNAHLVLGAYYLAVRRMADVEGEYRKAIALDPKNPGYEFVLGEFFRQQNRRDDAERAYQRAVAVDPEYAEAYHSLGHLYLDATRTADAERMFRKAAEVAVSYAEPHADLGKILRDRKDLEGAVREYRLALEIDPAHASSHHGLGHAYLDLRQNDAAEKAFLEAIKYNPGDWDPHKDLGSLYLEAKHYDLSIRYYQEALRLKPGDADIQRQLNQAMVARGNAPRRPVVDGGRRNDPRAIVFAFWEPDELWYPAKVENVDGDGVFVRYYDDSTQWKDRSRLCRYALAVGDRVSVDYRGRGLYYGAEVVRVNGERVRVRYDDGEQEETTVAALRMNLTSPTMLQVGRAVFGRWAADGYWYPARITAVNNRSYDVRWADGTKATLTESEISLYTLLAGDRVEVDWKNGGRYYRGLVRSRDGANLHIRYDDGSEDDVTADQVRLKTVSRRAAGY